VSSKIKKLTGETFSSLAAPNFRLYFANQAFALSGYFIQSIALSWLALKITNSGTVLGAVLVLHSLNSMIHNQAAQGFPV
jgi:hypothetical protein